MVAKRWNPKSRPVNPKEGQKSKTKKKFENEPTNKKMNLVSLAHILDHIPDSSSNIDTVIPQYSKIQTNR